LILRTASDNAQFMQPMLVKVPHPWSIH